MHVTLCCPWFFVYLVVCLFVFTVVEVVVFVILLLELESLCVERGEILRLQLFSCVYEGVSLIPKWHQEYIQVTILRYMPTVKAHWNII